MKKIKKNKKAIVVVSLGILNGRKAICFINFLHTLPMSPCNMYRSSKWCIIHW